MLISSIHYERTNQITLTTFLYFDLIAFIYGSQLTIFLFLVSALLISISLLLHIYLRETDRVKMELKQSGFDIDRYVDMYIIQKHPEPYDNFRYLLLDKEVKCFIEEKEKHKLHYTKENILMRIDRVKKLTKVDLGIVAIANFSFAFISPFIQFLTYALFFYLYMLGMLGRGMIAIAILVASVVILCCTEAILLEKLSRLLKKALFKLFNLEMIFQE